MEAENDASILAAPSRHSTGARASASGMAAVEGAGFQIAASQRYQEGSALLMVEGSAAGWRDVRSQCRVGLASAKVMVGGNDVERKTATGQPSLMDSALRMVEASLAMRRVAERGRFWLVTAGRTVVALRVTGDAVRW